MGLRRIAGGGKLVEEAAADAGRNLEDVRVRTGCVPGMRLEGPVPAAYPPSTPMRVPILALLATLLSATLARAEAIVVEPSPGASPADIAVSWQLPHGFDESELLLQIEGGPRVRLTDEVRGDHPRVVVVLPLLAGSARFVVRAGREIDGDHRGGDREEIDVAQSESFELAGLPATGRVPVRAPATRPVPGAAMEWWAEPAGRPLEGPSPALGRPPSAAEAEAGRAAPAVPSSRPLPAASPAGEASGPRDESPAAPSGTASSAREPAFPGASTPLRN